MVRVGIMIRCPRCQGGTLQLDEDGLRCFQCGGTPARLDPALEAELRQECSVQAGKQRRRVPSSHGMVL